MNIKKNNMSRYSNGTRSLITLKEELKSVKFFNHLRAIGLDDSEYQTDLGPVILMHTGLFDEADHTFNLYNALLDEHSSAMDIADESVTQHAFEVYMALMAEKKKRMG